MLGGIVGDYFGSRYEGQQNPNYNQAIGGSECTITDETILLSATADSMIHQIGFTTAYRKWANRFPKVAYGPGFSSWLAEEEGVRSSIGNGAASRCGILGYLNNEDKVIDLAEQSAICSHQHQEAIDGAKSVAWTVWALRNKVNQNDIVQKLYDNYDYFLSYEIEAISGTMGLDSTAFNTVPIALWVGLNAKSSIDCLRQCFQIGGDTDSIASIACLVNQQRFPIDKTLIDQIIKYLGDFAPSVLKMHDDFSKKFPDIN